ncbi:unnamed protein product [Ostreobium quekettii]|uniref:Uncharacterized protein n=1 Tax=Ostreobium quekettii TaxID=121088 RepID=A0A8S1IT39_9CHLO|nr:unnamed protein product [Ostreobium quekettii]
MNIIYLQQHRAVLCSQILFPEACYQAPLSTVGWLLAGIGVPVMAVGGASGVITVWHLEDKTLSTVIHAAHDGPVVSLFFFPATPILMSSSADNSIKQWIFDNVDGSARLLKYRCGHRAPPNCIKFYGQGYRVLSCGQDRAFWMFSTNQAQQSRELSQGHTARKAKKRKVHEEQVKLSRVTHLDACEVRERDWANGITAHEGDWRAYTWRLKDFTIGEHALEPPSRHGGRSLRPSPVTCVHLSECGNFGFVGSANGRLHRFNMQSGLHRGEYKRRKDDAGLPAHDGAVTGVATDSCNRSVVSTSYDGWLRIWSFPSQVLRAQVHTGCPVSHLLLHPGTSMCPLVGDDLTIRVYDAEAARLVRKFRGHTDRITALEMSSDGRWLLSAAMDGSVRVWDVPAGQVLQVMQLGSAVTSLSLSPAMDILATTHVNRRGIYLWSNQLVFGTGASVVPSEEPIDVLLPASFAGEGNVQPDDLPTVEGHRLEGPGTPDKPRILSASSQRACHPVDAATLEVARPGAPGRDTGEEQAHPATREAGGRSLLPSLPCGVIQQSNI